MKRGIKGYEEMTHQGTSFNGNMSNILILLSPEIMDILRVKKAQLPAAPLHIGRKRKERKVVSAAAITESDSQRDPPAEAGPSTGPGTLGNLVTTSIPVHQDSDEDDSSDSD
jgi:Myb-like DNA-binding protein REB1